jgi:hypothetical protein
VQAAPACVFISSTSCANALAAVESYFSTAEIADENPEASEVRSANASSAALRLLRPTALLRFFRARRKPTASFMGPLDEKSNSNDSSAATLIRACSSTKVRDKLASVATKTENKIATECIVPRTLFTVFLRVL